VWRVTFLREEVAPKGEWEEWRLCWWLFVMCGRGEEEGERMEWEEGEARRRR